MFIWRANMQKIETHFSHLSLRVKLFRPYLWRGDSRLNSNYCSHYSTTSTQHFSCHSSLLSSSSTLKWISPFLHWKQNRTSDNLQRDPDDLRCWKSCTWKWIFPSRSSKWDVLSLNNDTNNEIAIYLWQLNIFAGLMSVQLDRQLELFCTVAIFQLTTINRRIEIRISFLFRCCFASSNLLACRVIFEHKSPALFGYDRVNVTPFTSIVNIISAIRGVS